MSFQSKVQDLVSYMHVAETPVMYKGELAFKAL